MLQYITSEHILCDLNLSLWIRWMGIPKIEEILHEYGRRHNISILDQISEYWEYAPTESCKTFADFVTGRGIYQSEAIPFQWVDECNRCGNSWMNFSRSFSFSVSNRMMWELYWRWCLNTQNDLASSSNLSWIIVPRWQESYVSWLHESKNYRAMFTVVRMSVDEKSKRHDQEGSISPDTRSSKNVQWPADYFYLVLKRSSKIKLVSYAVCFNNKQLEPVQSEQCSLKKVTIILITTLMHSVSTLETGFIVKRNFPLKLLKLPCLKRWK